MISPARSSRSRSSALSAVVAGSLVLLLAGCGGSDVEDAEDATAAAEDEPAGDDEPEYEGLPEDLTADEVCSLLDEATVTEHLAADVNEMKPGERQPDCQWWYKLDGGPVTNLQVQVMSMDQTDERLGSEALEWGLRYAPEEAEVTEVESLNTPNATYEFGSSSVIFAVDPVGRLITVSTHSETSEEGRIALTEAVLDALAANHS